MDSCIHFSIFPVTSTSAISPALTLKERLKYDRRADHKYASCKRRKTNAAQGRSQCKKLIFNEIVEVRPIPMRSEYSFPIRSRIWSSALEIQQNAERNTFEFATEGWDWRSVKEDHQMYRCVATNELLHPCWVNGTDATTGSNKMENSFAKASTAV
jgi:hypothetical protein